MILFWYALILYSFNTTLSLLLFYPSQSTSLTHLITPYHITSPPPSQIIRRQLESDRETKERWLNAKPPENARKIPNLRGDLVQAKKQEDAVAQVAATLPHSLNKPPMSTPLLTPSLTPYVNSLFLPHD